VPTHALRQDRLFEEGAVRSSSNCQDLSATSKAESGNSSARYLPWKSEGRHERLIGVACSQTRSIASSIPRKVRQLLNNPSLLAEFQVAIEGAASVLGRVT
jgi:hypothetical protein